MPLSPDLKTKVLEKIKSGGVHRRPRIYFVAQVALIAMLLVIALILSVFVMSFVIFSVCESGEQFLLGFGRQGIATFFLLFPWAPLLLDVFLLTAIEFLSRRFKFGYRVSVARLAATIFAFALFGSIVLDLTPLHSMLLGRADRDELPVVGEWYESIHASHRDQGVFRGVVTSINGNEFVIVCRDGDRDGDDGTWTVAAPPGFAMASIRAGDVVYVAGNLMQGVVQAYGVQKL